MKQLEHSSTQLNQKAKDSDRRKPSFCTDARTKKAIFKTRNAESGNGERGIFKTGNLLKRESFKLGIFKSGNLSNGESLKAGISKTENL